jgi:hypothetical protein
VILLTEETGVLSSDDSDKGSSGSGDAETMQLFIRAQAEATCTRVRL